MGRVTSKVHGKQTSVLSLDARLKLYDAATMRQRHRQQGRAKLRRGGDRGWRREDLYTRGRAEELDILRPGEREFGA